MASLRGAAFVLLSFASFFAGGGVQVGSAAAAGEFAARPDLNSSSFTATSGGGLRIGVEYGAVDEFILVEGKLGECDAAGFAVGRAKLSGEFGNCSLVDFDVDVSYRCDTPPDPRWIPQTTITGKSASSSSSPVTYVFGYELADFEITVAGYARSLSFWVFAGSIKGTIAAGRARGADPTTMEWVFDTRQSEWDEAVTTEYETANLKATLSHAESSHCTSAGQFVDGSMSINMTAGEGSPVAVLEGPTTGARRCGSDLAHLGRYSLNMAASDTVVALSDTMTLSLTKTQLNVKGNNPAGMERSLDFGILAWEGTYTGAAAVNYQEDATLDDEIFSATTIVSTVPFKSAADVFVIDPTKVTSEAKLNFAYPTSSSAALTPALEIVAEMPVVLPCPVDGSPAMLAETAKLTITTKDLTMSEDTGRFSYFCGGGGQSRISASVVVTNATVKGMQVDNLTIALEAKKEVSGEAFAFKVWATGKSWVDGYYVDVDFYVNLETGEVESAFRYEFVNYDKSLKVTAVGTRTAGCAPKGEKVWIEVSYDGGKEIKIDKLKGYGSYYNCSAAQQLSESEGGVMYEAAYEMDELVVTKAGIELKDVTMTAVATRGAAEDISDVKQMHWAFAFQGTFGAAAGSEYSAVGNATFTLARDPADGMVTWESVDIGLAMKNAMISNDDSAKLIVDIAPFEFSFPANRITCAAKVKATVSKVFLGSMDARVVMYSPSSAVEGETGLVVRITGQGDMPMEMKSFANGELMTFTMKTVNFVIEGYQSALALTAGIDLTWAVLPSFEELDMRGYFTGMTTIQSGGDFSPDDVLATLMSFNKKTRHSFEVEVHIGEAAEKTEFDAAPLRASLVGVASKTCKDEGDAMAGKLTFENDFTYFSVGAKGTKFCKSNRAYDEVVVATLPEVTIYEGITVRNARFFMSKSKSLGAWTGDIGGTLVVGEGGVLAGSELITGKDEKLVTATFTLDEAGFHMNNVVLDIDVDFMAGSSRDPTLIVAARGNATLPCRGDTIVVPADVEMKTSLVKFDAITMSVTFPCVGNVKEASAFTSDGVMPTLFFSASMVEMKDVAVRFKGVRDEAGEMIYSGAMKSEAKPAAKDGKLYWSGTSTFSISTKESLTLSSKISASYGDDSIVFKADGALFVEATGDANTKLAAVAGSLVLEGKKTDSSPLKAQLDSLDIFYPDKETSGMRFQGYATSQSWKIDEFVSAKALHVALAGVVNAKNGGFDFDANVTGAVDVVAGEDNLVTQLASMSQKSSFWINTTFSKRRCISEKSDRAQCGFSLGADTSIRAAYDITTPSITLVGEIDVKYPCIKGTSMTGSAMVSISAGSEMNLAGNKSSVTFSCGVEVGADAASFGIAFISKDPVHLTSNICVDQMKVGAKAFRKRNSVLQVIGTISGVVSNECTSPGALANLGLPAAAVSALESDEAGKVSYFFDTAPADGGGGSLGQAPGGEFHPAQKFDFIAGCIKGFVEASGANPCKSASDPPLVLAGLVSFACDEVKGSGEATAVKTCGAVASNAVLYNMTIKITTLKVRGAAVKGDVKLIATIASDGETDIEDLVWTLEGTGLGLAPGVSSSVDLPSVPTNPEDVQMSANFRAVKAFNESLLLEEATMRSTFVYTSDFTEPEEPSVTVSLDMDAPYPCMVGTAYTANANVTLKNFEGVDNIDDLADIPMKAYLYCKPGNTLPAFKLYGTVDTIEMKKNIMTNAKMAINAFKRNGKFTFVDTATGEVNSEDFNLEGGVKDVMSNSAAISFSTKNDVLSFMVELDYETTNFAATMMASVAKGRCDAELGIAMFGDVVVTIDYKNQQWSMPFNVSLEGSKQCGAHLKLMEEEGRPAQRFLNNYQRFIALEDMNKNSTGDFRGESMDISEMETFNDNANVSKAIDTASDLMNVALSNKGHPDIPSWPQYYFEGKMNEPTQVFPAIFIKNGTVTMTSAGEYGTSWERMPFLYEVYGEVDLAFMCMGKKPGPPGITNYIGNLTTCAAFTYVPGATYESENRRRSLP